MAEPATAQAQAPAVPLPGTPEYEELYQAALKELEAAEAPATTPPVVTTPAAEPPTVPGAAPPAVTPPIPAAFAPEAQTVIDALTADLESQGKRLKDTQDWTHGIVHRLRDWYKEIRTAQAQGERPIALEDIDGLEEAIQHVVKGSIGPEDDLFPELAGQGDAGTPSVFDYTDDQWTGIVATALPDMDELLADPGLMTAVETKKADMGDDWKNPLLAINAMSELRSDFLHKQNVDAAVKTAIENMSRTTQRASAMQVPGGGAGVAEPPPIGGNQAGSGDPVQDAGVWSSKNMTDEEFEKRRQAVLTQ